MYASSPSYSASPTQSASRTSGAPVRAFRRLQRISAQRGVSAETRPVPAEARLQSKPDGAIRFRYSSNMGTVKAVLPYSGP